MYAWYEAKYTQSACIYIPMQLYCTLYMSLVVTTVQKVDTSSASGAVMYACMLSDSSNMEIVN